MADHSHQVDGKEVTDIAPSAQETAARAGKFRDDAADRSQHHLDGVSRTSERLRQALNYTLAVDRNEGAIRRFLIWATLLATSTMRKISAQPLYSKGSEVKVSRRRVAAIVALSNTMIRSNFGLTALFNASALGLPKNA